MTYTPPTSATALGTLTVTQYNTEVKDNIAHIYSYGTALAGTAGTAVNLTATQGSVVAARGNLRFSHLSTPFVAGSVPFPQSFAFTANDDSYYVLLTTVPASNFIHHLAYTSNGGTSFTFPNGGTAGTGLPQAYGAGYNPGKIASSSNGSIVYFAPHGGGTAGVLLNIYKSTDSGATFSTTSSGTNSWRDVACSTSGSIVYAGGSSSILYSANTGTTWSTATIASFSSPSSYQICCSANGSVAFVAVGDINTSGNVYKTTDAGASWSTATALGSRKWKNINCSSNGSVVVASALSGTSDVYSYLYLSTDSGANWSSLDTLGLDKWESATISPDGNYIVARGTHRTFSSKNMGTTFYLEPSIQHDMGFYPGYSSPSGSVVVNLSPNSKVSFI